MLEILAVLGAVFVVSVLTGFRVLREYERAIVFRLGRARKRPLSDSMMANPNNVIPLAPIEQPDTREAMSRIGAHDISISLDSVVPPMQDVINGGYDRSWEVAIRTMANVNELFPRDS